MSDFRKARELIHKLVDFEKCADTLGPLATLDGNNVLLTKDEVRTLLKYVQCLSDAIISMRTPCDS